VVAVVADVYFVLTSLEDSLIHHPVQLSALQRVLNMNITAAIWSGCWLYGGNIRINVMSV
jgi:hypothetical protein